MRRTVGGLRATPEGLKLLAAVRELGELAGRQVMTTKLDILVELESSVVGTHVEGSGIPYFHQGRQDSRASARSLG